METTLIKEAITWLEKSNADLEPGLLSADGARAMLDDYARAEKLAAYGRTVLAQRIADAAEVARATGVSMGKARAALDAGDALTPMKYGTPSSPAPSLWTRRARSPGPRTPVPAPPTTFWT
jgi:hypothetical protein